MFPNSDSGARGPPQQPGVPGNAGFRGPPGSLAFGPPVNNPGMRGPAGNAAFPSPPSNPGSFGGPPSNQALGGVPLSNPAFGGPPSNPPFVGGPLGNPALRGPPTNQGFAAPPSGPLGRSAGPPTGPPPGGPPSVAGPNYPRPASHLATPSSMAQLQQRSQPPPYNAISSQQQQQQQQPPPPSQPGQFSGAFPPSAGARGPLPGAPPAQPGSGHPPLSGSGPLPYGQGGPVPLSTQFQNMNLAAQGQSGVRAPPPVFGLPPGAHGIGEPGAPPTWQSGGQAVSLGPPQRIYPDAAAVGGPPTGGVPHQPPGLPNQYARGPPHMPPTMGHIPGVVEKYGPGVPGMPQPVSPTTPNPASGASRIDPNQIPRPLPGASFVEFETRVNGQANLPPSATANFLVKDTGNCSPRLMRSTLNQIPCSGDLLSTSGMPLAVMVQPFAPPNPSEEPIQVVDFGESGPVRCARCKGYINPFMKFIDQGRRFVCNLCGFTNETPRDYHCNLGPDGRRRDIDQRPELSKGTVEFVASKEYLVRPPMPPVYYFLVDVSASAVQSGAVVAACSAINRALGDLPEGPRTMVGIATFDSTIHFYALNKNLQQAAMLVVPDIQDVYTPLQSDLIVPLSEVREHLEQLLDSIPSMFQNNRVPEAAFGAAIKGAFLAMKSTGGKLLVFQSVLPSVGVGALTPRQSEGRLGGEKEYLKLMQPADKTFKTMAIEFAEFQVCVELFLMCQQYVDITSLSAVPQTTGGQVYYYNPFSAEADSAKLYNDLRWNVTRAQGLEAVMRVRCSQGLQVEDYYGNFCRRIPTDVDLPAIDCDKTIMVTFKHEDKFQEGSECCFQCALLYTTITGDRRIRVITLSLSCTSLLSNLFRGADLDAQFTYLLKHAAQEVPTVPLSQVREQITSQCVNILYTYRKFCATASSSGQLILPEALKLLPLYTIALAKSIGLRFDSRSDNQVDERAYWLTRVSSLSASLAIPVVYPRMFAIHKLPSQDALGGAILPPVVPLSSEHLDQDGIFLLETGEDAYIYVGKQASPELVQQLFGVNSVDEILNGQIVLPVFENESSKRLNAIVNEIRRQRYSYLRLRLLRRGDPLEFLFFNFLVEDKSSAGLSYVEFLVHVHRQIQNKMT